MNACVCLCVGSAYCTLWRLRRSFNSANSIPDLASVPDAWRTNILIIVNVSNDLLREFWVLMACTLCGPREAALKKGWHVFGGDGGVGVFGGGGGELPFLLCHGAPNPLVCVRDGMCLTGAPACSGGLVPETIAPRLAYVADRLRLKQKQIETMRRELSAVGCPAHSPPPPQCCVTHSRSRASSTHVLGWPSYALPRVAVCDGVLYVATMHPHHAPCPRTTCGLCRCSRRP
jgi:hypothetical protein